MRIVQFDKNAIPAEYPANFRKTALIGDVYVGEYSGSDAGIADYLGDYPLPIYSKSISRTDFKTLFTAIEYRAISVMSETDDNLFQFWDMAQTADHVDMADERTQGGLNYIALISTEGNKLPDAARVAVIMLGKLQ